MYLLHASNMSIVMAEPNCDQVLFQVVESVTDTFLKMPAVAASAPTSGQVSTDEQWSGTVQIAGGFNGSIRLSCSRAFAHKAARMVFGEDYPVDDAFARDVLAELTNI